MLNADTAGAADIDDGIAELYDRLRDALLQEDPAGFLSGVADRRGGECCAGFLVDLNDACFGALQRVEVIAAEYRQGADDVEGEKDLLGLIGCSCHRNQLLSSLPYQGRCGEVFLDYSFIIPCQYEESVIAV